MDAKKFVLGTDKVPDWFIGESSSGRAKINYDEETGKIVNATIFSPTGTIVAKPGDVIIKTRTGVGIVNNDKAKKYGVTKRGWQNGILL